MRDESPAPVQLLVATELGNQALAYGLGANSETFRLRGATELFPLRRFGGRALPNVQGAARYDSGCRVYAGCRSYSSRGYAIVTAASS